MKLFDKDYEGAGMCQRWFKKFRVAILFFKMNHVKGALLSTVVVLRTVVEANIFFLIGELFSDYENSLRV